VNKRYKVKLILADSYDITAILLELSEGSVLVMACYVTGGRRSERGIGIGARRIRYRANYGLKVSRAVGGVSGEQV
jgi:hypothetical protein